MNLDDLKDRIKADLQRTLERLEENSTFVSLRDRYESLTPIMQKVVVGGAFGVLALVLVMIPYGTYDNSNTIITEFESKRSLIRDLFKVQKEINETPEIAMPPAASAVKSRIESDLQNAQLLPEQMKGVSVLPPADNDLVKAVQNEAVVEVNLGQLNLKQVVDLGYQFQNISPSVKMKDLVVQATQADPRYFDVVYRLLVLKVTPEDAPPAEEPAKNNRRGRR